VPVFYAWSITHGIQGWTDLCLALFNHLICSPRLAHMCNLCRKCKGLFRTTAGNHYLFFWHELCLIFSGNIFDVQRLRPPRPGKRNVFPRSRSGRAAVCPNGFTPFPPAMGTVRSPWNTAGRSFPSRPSAQRAAPLGGRPFTLSPGFPRHPEFRPVFLDARTR
jgi:hypothetical protein